MNIYYAVPSIRQSELPDDALLTEYARGNNYTDCFVTEIASTVSQAEYVTAFYTTFLFKIERLILRWLVRKPSSDSEARQLADGELETFAAWYVEQRREDQLLMCDFRDKTRSWLMVSRSPGQAGSRLYFGSAVVPVYNAKTGASSQGLVFKLLAGFHKVYSVALLYSARSRLEAQDNLNARRHLSMNGHFKNAFLFLAIFQALHSLEEYVFKLWEHLYPARLLSGLVSEDLSLGFAVINSTIVVLIFWSYLVPLRNNLTWARHVVWFWAVLETLNAIGHLWFGVSSGGYFPGLYTAPFLLVLGIFLIRQLMAGRAAT